MVWVLLLAGCTGAGDGDLPVEDPEALPLRDLAMTGCAGSGVRLEVPEQLLDVPVPPGWDGENGLPTTVTMFTIFCEHLSWGPFERGPVQAVVESHEKFNAPLNCREGDYTYLNILTRMVWSDAEIAAVVQEELGIPTSVGAIRAQTAGPGLAGVTTYSWTIDGRESSYEVGFFQNEVTEPATTYRYVWPDVAQERLGFVDFSWDGRQSWLEPFAAAGTMSEPMLLSSAGLPRYSGVGGIQLEFFPGGEFKFYEGYECATPWSP